MSENRQRRFPLFTLAKIVGVPLVRLLFRLEVRGRARVPREGGLIVVANHISHLDPPLLAAALPRPVDYLAQAELFHGRFWSWVFGQLRAIPIHRANPERASVREAARRLKEGRCVGIFPEGGIRLGRESVLGGAPRMEAGAAGLAMLTDVPVLPALIVGSREGYDWKGLLQLRRPCVRVSFGEPFRLTSAASREAATAEMAMRLVALAREAPPQ